MIWNFAGDYDIDPAFMAYFPDGTPDHSFDMVIGLAYKWLDMDKLTEFFHEYGRDRRAEEFDAFLWLGIENCVYEKEIGERPVLNDLRRDRGEQFFKIQQTLSRQQMMYQSMPVYTQQEARWSATCGRRMPVMTNREKRMAERLMFAGSLDTEGILNEMRGFLDEFYKYHTDSAGKLGNMKNLPGILMKREHKRKDTFLIRTGTGEGNHPRAVSQRHERLGRFAETGSEDTEYIKGVFGDNLLSDREQRIMDNELCTGEHEGCRLWIAKGDHTLSKAVKSQSREAEEIQRSRERQLEQNRSYLEKNRAMTRSSIRHLSAHVDTILSSYLRQLPEKSRTGSVMPDRAYRLSLLQDPSVFLRAGEETEQKLMADILLDASQSRMHSQETIAAEAYIIASSLVSVHIPVRVCAFRSLRGYTVIEVLKGAADKDCKGILSYYAGGWNRDSLAIMAAGRYYEKCKRDDMQRMMLVLTDANPNDSAPFYINSGRVKREYEGVIAVRDTEDAVSILKNDGIKTGAVFSGNPAHLGNVQQIYGNDYVHIRRTEGLARGVADLLLKMLTD
ncbi:MAG: hypothetical protein IJ641_10075 [Lachnospiraceae bacterium]|nr:hypothetical protein [Lachnospiraceae bacterium]